MSGVPGCSLLRQYLREAEVSSPLPEALARHLPGCRACSELWQERRQLNETLLRHTQGAVPELTAEEWREKWRRIRRSLAPGWTLRCLSCGARRPLGHAGGIRLGARGTKFGLAWCHHCRKLRIAMLRRESDPQSE